MTPTAAGPLTGTVTHQHRANAFAAARRPAAARGMTSSGGSLAFCGLAQTLDTWDKQDGCNGVPQFLSSNCKDHIMIVNDALDLVSSTAIVACLIAQRTFATHARMHCIQSKCTQQLNCSHRARVCFPRTTATFVPGPLAFTPTTPRHLRLTTRDDRHNSPPADRRWLTAIHAISLRTHRAALPPTRMAALRWLALLFTLATFQW